MFAAALQEDNAGSNDNKIYALRAGFIPAKNVTLRATFAKYDYADSTGDVNFGAIDGSYTKGKASFYADYAKSDAAAKNTAYSVGVAYNFDGVNSVSLYNYKVEAMIQSMDGQPGGAMKRDIGIPLTIRLTPILP